ANFSDGSTQDLTSQVSWTSSNNSIAQISDAPGTKGLVTGLGVGDTSIIATIQGIQGSAMVVETAAALISITITPPDSSLAKGTAVQLTATGNLSDGSTEDLTNQVSWKSGSDLIAQISNVLGSEGLVAGLNSGNTSITATLNGIQGFTNLSVTVAT